MSTTNPNIAQQPDPLVSENSRLKLRLGDAEMEIKGLKKDRDYWIQSADRYADAAQKIETDLGKVRNAIGSIKFDEITKK